MPRVLLRRNHLRRIIRRTESGAYRWDEVWDGVCVVSPDPDIQHQGPAVQLTSTLVGAIGDIAGIRIFPSVNISGREDCSTENDRCPDASVFLPGDPAQHRGAYWPGGPDFAVEILSRGDRARRKLPFDAGVNVREVLPIDRAPWRLGLHRRHDDRFTLVGTSTPIDPEPVPSDVLPLSFRLVPGEPRPLIEFVRQDGTCWTF